MAEKAKVVSLVWILDFVFPTLNHMSSWWLNSSVPHEAFSHQVFWCLSEQRERKIPVGCRSSKYGKRGQLPLTNILLQTTVMHFVNVHKVNIAQVICPTSSRIWLQIISSALISSLSPYLPKHSHYDVKKCTFIIIIGCHPGLRGFRRQPQPFMSEGDVLVRPRETLMIKMARHQHGLPLSDEGRAGAAKGNDTFHHVERSVDNKEISWLRKKEEDVNKRKHVCAPSRSFPTVISFISLGFFH